MASTTRFVIAGTQRTGTTLIRTCLSSHPAILCQGEVFQQGKKPYKQDGGYWKYYRRSFKSRIQAVLNPSRLTASFLEDMYGAKGYSAIGFKLMMSHCQSMPHLWSQLLAQDIKAILVRRQNALKTLVSRRAAVSSGVYHVSTEMQNKASVRNWVATKIRIDTTKLIKDIQSIEAEHADWKLKLDRNVEYIEIDYEDYVKNQSGTNERMMNFLGTEKISLTSDLKKVNPDDLQDIIGNYTDVVQILQNTQYADFLVRASAL